MHPREDGSYAFPFASHIRPVFVSMHIAYPDILKQERVVEYLKKHQPIGCRDHATCKLMQQYGIESYFSSCLTTTLEIPHDEDSNTVRDESLEVDTMQCNVTHQIPNMAEAMTPDEALEFAFSQLVRYSRAERVHSTRIHCLLPTRAVSDATELVFGSRNGGQDQSWMGRPRFSGLVETMQNATFREVHATVLFETLTQKVHDVLFGFGLDAVARESDPECVNLCDREQLPFDARHIRLQHPSRIVCSAMSKWAAVLADAHVPEIEVVGGAAKRLCRDFVLRRCPLRSFDARLDIYVTFDNGYASVFPVFLRHLARSNANALLRVWCATRGVTRLHDVVTNTPPNVILYHFPMDEVVVFNNYRSPLGHVSNVCMDRLAVELLDFGGRTVNRVIYLDLDICVTGSLLPLLDVDTGVKGIAAKSSKVRNVMSNWISKYEAMNELECGKAETKLSYPYNRSFNAGVLVMDLEKLRRGGMFAFCKKMYETHGVNDQIALNFYCEAKYAELPAAFNVFVSQDHEDFLVYDPRQKTTAGVVWHFVGSKKPWDFATAENYPYAPQLWDMWHYC